MPTATGICKHAKDNQIRMPASIRILICILCHCNIEQFDISQMYYRYANRTSGHLDMVV